MDVATQIARSSAGGRSWKTDSPAITNRVVAITA